MNTLRQLHGISGYTNIFESEYDCFGAGHSSTSISAALGMSVGKNLLGKLDNHCIAVIGDGAITGGMAYEAMNNAAYINSKILVVLNDNGQVSLPTGQLSAGGTIPAGALSGYTSRLITSNAFKTVRDLAKSINTLFPGDIQVSYRDPPGLVDDTAVNYCMCLFYWSLNQWTLHHYTVVKNQCQLRSRYPSDCAHILACICMHVQSLNKRFDEYVRGIATGGTLFEELGFYYVGPVDGHDLDTLIPILENIRDNVPNTKPVLLHIKTTKGKGKTTKP